MTNSIREGLRDRFLTNQIGKRLRAIFVMEGFVTHEASGCKGDKGEMGEIGKMREMGEIGKMRDLTHAPCPTSKAKGQNFPNPNLQSPITCSPMR